MATLAQHPAITTAHGHTVSGLRNRVGAAWESLGLIGRRAAVTAAGALVALSCGAAVAGAVRLPAEDQGSTPVDPATMQTELPSEAAARTYALENPPAYTMASNADADAHADATALPDVSTDFTIPADGAVTKAAYTTPAEDEDKAQPVEQTATLGASPSAPVVPVAVAGTSGA